VHVNAFFVKTKIRYIIIIIIIIFFLTKQRTTKCCSGNQGVGAVLIPPARNLYPGAIAQILIGLPRSGAGVGPAPSGAMAVSIAPGATL